MQKSLVLAVACLAGPALPANAVSQGSVCGWYAIATCSTSEFYARTFADKGWGAVINTSQYQGFRTGLFCVVSGPQPKPSAERDRLAAIKNGVALDVYVKQACTDKANIGD